MRKRLFIAGVLSLAALILGLVRDNEPTARSRLRVDVADKAPPDTEPPERVPMTQKIEAATAARMTGSITLAFTAETGEPVEGVQVSLRQPGRRTDAREAIASDKDGIVSWKQLSAGSYQWEIRSNERFWPDDEPTGETPLRSSERISLSAGQDLRMAITLFSGEVRGTLELPGRLTTRPIVKTLDVQDDGESEEAVVRTNDGSFRFTTISSGSKILSAVAEVEDQHFYFYRRAFTIEPGGSVDLGRIFPLQGGTYDGTIVLDHEGDHLTAASVYGVEEMKAILQVLNRDVRPEDLFVTQIFDVRVGEPFYLHGLPDREWLLNATAGYHGNDFWPPPRSGFQVNAESHAIVHASQFTGVILPFEVSTAVPVTIRVLYPDEAKPFRTTVVLYSNNRQGHELRIRAPESGREAMKRLELPMGLYRVLAHPDPLIEEAESFWFGESSVDVHGRETEMVIAFERGTCIRGRLRDSKAHSIGVLFPDWHDRNGQPVYAYKARPDENGTFVIPGVPPDRELLFTAGSGHVSTRSGHSGTVTEFNLLSTARQD